MGFAARITSRKAGRRLRSYLIRAIIPLMTRDNSISSRISALLDKSERQIFDDLDTPEAIQDHLDSLSINFEDGGETYYSPRLVMRHKTAHCFEGALFAAAVLAYHGARPLLMDFQTAPDDTDHVIALFRRGGGWGAISKTNHAVLRYRDPVYTSPRELAMSYFHEYFTPDGQKSLCAYSAPFDVSRFALSRWLTAEEDLHWLAGELDHSHHFSTVSHNILSTLRTARPIEIDASFHIEWSAQSVRAPRGTRDSSSGSDTRKAVRSASSHSRKRSSSSSRRRAS